MSIKLVDAKTVRTRLSLPDDEGVNLALKSALDATSYSLEATLDTLFAQGTKVDIFKIDSARDFAVDSNYRLRLSNGFVLTTPTPTIKYAGTLTDLVSGSTLAFSETLLSSELGFLHVPDTLAGSYVQVEYTYGFLPSDPIPEWLKEAALSYTVKVMAMQQISSGKPDLTEVFKFVSEHYSNIMDRHLRVSSRCIKPLAR